MGFASDLAEQRERQRRRSVADPYGVTAEEYDDMYPGTLRAEELQEEQARAEPEYTPHEIDWRDEIRADFEADERRRQKALQDDARKKAASGVAAIVTTGPLGAVKMVADGIQKGTKIAMKGLQNVVSGKGTDQLGRDYFRRAMQQMGLADQDFNVRFADGAEWNIGKGGRLSNVGDENVTYKENEYADQQTQKGTHKIFQVDATDPFAARLVSIADPLSRILAQAIPAGGESYKDDIAGTFYNLMRETGNNPYLRMRGVWNKLGFDEAAKAHAALDEVSGLSDWEKIVMHGNIDRTYAGATDSGVDQKHGEGWIDPIHRDAFIADAQAKGATTNVLDDEGYVIEANTPGFKYRKGRGAVW
jgi:hypothetical protein